eukprot:SM000070S21343  [mRNA]  locus=s70:405618:406614:- [translate_table: standard]
MRRRRVASAPHLPAAASSMPGSRSRPAGRGGAAVAAVADAALPSSRLRCFGRPMAATESYQTGARALPSVPLRATAHARVATSNGPPPTSRGDEPRLVGRRTPPLKPQTPCHLLKPSAAADVLPPDHRAERPAAAAAAAAAAKPSPLTPLPPSAAAARRHAAPDQRDQGLPAHCPAQGCAMWVPSLTPPSPF